MYIPSTNHSIGPWDRDISNLNHQVLPPKLTVGTWKSSRIVIRNIIWTTQLSDATLRDLRSINHRPIARPFGRHATYVSPRMTRHHEKSGPIGSFLGLMCWKSVEINIAYLLILYIWILAEIIPIIKTYCPGIQTNIWVFVLLEFSQWVWPGMASSGFVATVLSFWNGWGTCWRKHSCCIYLRSCHIINYYKTIFQITVDMNEC